MKNRQVIWRNFRLTLRSAPLAMAASFLAVSAMADSVTATKNCLGSTCSVTEAVFHINTALTVNWEASYTGTPTQGHRFFLSTTGSNMADIELTSGTGGQLSGTKFLAAGRYFISIRTFLMGPGSYSVFGSGVIGDPHIT